MADKLTSLKPDKLLHGFRTLRSFQVPEFRTMVVQFEHEKTGARFTHLGRDDANKAFSVQFRTTPFDNCGVSHILEHTVLCGSVKYPVRDPFFKMLRRSQATFMNAFTASDWTMYPFSTMNYQDFQNLLRVYTDAVFQPKLDETDFMQEGWRLEPVNLSDPASSELQIKGIVFNEMKGVFSNSLNRFAQTVSNRLMPETYGFVSGGNPDDIPSLSWQSLKDFHASYYHPSNAFLRTFTHLHPSSFYTYGDAPLDWTLDFLNAEYLSKYDRITLNNAVDLENRWTGPRKELLFTEPDTTCPDPERQATVSVSYLLDDIRDVYSNFLINLTTGLLIDGDNAPLYRGLIESGLGLDWADGVAGMEGGHRTTSLHVGIQGVRVKEVDQVADKIVELLGQVVRDGLPRERVEAALHQYELAIKHESARFGLGLIVRLSHAVNHDVDLSEALNINALIERFRGDLKENPALLQDLIQSRLLDNPHRLTTIMQPDSNWKSEQLAKEKALLSSLTRDLTDQDKHTLANKALDLEKRQKAEEDVSCLPCLDLFDIPLKPRPEPFTLVDVSNCSVQLNEAPTNDLVYLHGLFNLSHLPPDLLPYVPLFCLLFPRLGADGLDYRQMDQAIDLHTGGLSMHSHVVPRLMDDDGTDKDTVAEAVASIHLSSHCLESNVERMFDLIGKLFTGPDWSDRARLSTLVLQSATGDWSPNAMVGSAHRYAMSRASAGLSPTRRLIELWSGIEQAQLFQSITTSGGGSDQVPCQLIVDRLVRIWRHLASLHSAGNRLRFSLHGESEGLSSCLTQLDKFASTLSPSPSTEDVQSPSQLLSSTSIIPPLSFIPMPSYSVHFTAKSIAAPAYNSPDYANDPHVKVTFDAYKASLLWACDTEHSTQDINEAKLAVFQELDQPVSAGSRGLTHFLTGIDDDLRAEHRTKVFGVEAGDLVDAADHLIYEPDNGSAVIGPAEASSMSEVEGEFDIVKSFL